MKQNRISIVIPVFNEKESLRPLVSGLMEVQTKTSEYFEYIFIDDGSSDGSFEELLHVKKTLKLDCKIIRLRRNLGKSAALSVGFVHARGAYVITMDADLQDDPNEIPGILGKLGEGYDLVVGWRQKRNDIGGKIRLSKVFNTVVSWMMKLPLHDMNCGLKGMRLVVAKEIDLYGELHRYIPVLAAARGFRVTEVAVRHHERVHGVSKFGFERVLRAPFDLITTLFLTSYKTRPLHIFGLFGLLIGLMGIVPLLYLTYLHFIGISIGRRPLLQMGVLFVLFGVQLFSTGLLAELFVSSRAEKDTYPVREIIE